PRVGLNVATAVQPGLVVETDNIDDERVALPATNRIADVGRIRIVRVFRVDGDGAEDIHVLVHEDDLCRRLYDLDRKQADDGEPRHAGRQTVRGGIVDAATIERFEH